MVLTHTRAPGDRCFVVTLAIAKAREAGKGSPADLEKCTSKAGMSLGINDIQHWTCRWPPHRQEPAEPQGRKVARIHRLHRFHRFKTVGDPKTKPLSPLNRKALLKQTQIAIMVGPTPSLRSGEALGSAPRPRGRGGYARTDAPVSNVGPAPAGPGQAPALPSRKEVAEQSAQGATYSRRGRRTFESATRSLSAHAEIAFPLLPE